MTKVAVGILRENGKILICQRKKLARYGLKWEFPGGKIENNESPAECLRRELKEELSIDAVVGELCFRHMHTYTDSGSFDVLYYFVTSYRPIHDRIENIGFEQIKWIPEKQLAGTDMLDGNREVVQHLMNSH